MGWAGRNSTIAETLNSFGAKVEASIAAEAAKVTQKIEELKVEQDLIKGRQAAAAFVTGLQFIIFLIYLLGVFIKKMVELVYARKEEALEQIMIEMESRLVERKRKSWAERSKLSPAKE